MHKENKTPATSSDKKKETKKREPRPKNPESIPPAKKKKRISLSRIKFPFGNKKEKNATNLVKKESSKSEQKVTIKVEEL